MKWIERYKLFLFDFDGLLVNTEALHYKAYQRMCARHGIVLDWSERRYAESALFSATALRDSLLVAFPTLTAYPWEMLYQQKKEAYLELLNEGAVSLMPGAGRFIQMLAHLGGVMAVVTHSPSEQIELIKEQQPLLKIIPHWITREHYSQPKPHPECYKKAIELFSASGPVVGFEDSPRGLRALLGSGSDGVLVSSLLTKEEVEPHVDRPFTFAKSFDALVG